MLGAIYLPSLLYDYRSEKLVLGLQWLDYQIFS